MSFKEQITDIAVAWVGLHLVGLAMYLNGLTGPSYAVYTFISTIWWIEFWILVVALLTAAIILIINFCFSSPRETHAPKRIPAKLTEPEQLLKPTDTLVKLAPPTKPPEHTPESLKEKAISQILGKEQ